MKNRHSFTLNSHGKMVLLYTKNMYVLLCISSIMDIYGVLRITKTNSYNF